MARKWYSVGLYLDGEPLDQCQVKAGNPRVAVNRAMAVWFAIEYGRDRELQVDEQLTIQITRRGE